jgi:hypothetical protein
MPRPTTPPKRGFHLPPDLPVTKIIPDYDNDTATIYFTKGNKERTITIPFTWDMLEDFE